MPNLLVNVISVFALLLCAALRVEAIEPLDLTSDIQTPDSANCSPLDKTTLTKKTTPTSDSDSDSNSEQSGDTNNCRVTQGADEPIQQEKAEQKQAQQEKALEEERLKVLFVDVNSVMETIGSSMDWTANQLDGYFADSDENRDKAKAWGHVVFGWQPVEGQFVDTDNFPVKFKVKARLPNLEDRVEIILSDGDDDDFETLPYESVRPEALQVSETSLGAAIQFLSSKGKYLDSSSRLGISESQVYARSTLTYRSKHLSDVVTFNLQPAIEYYADDGWGARLLVDTGYKISDSSEMRYNVSFRDRESYDDPSWRNGIFNIYAVGEKAAFITGYSSSGEFEHGGEVRVYSRRLSTRYRFNALRSWIYFEIEPFIEFNKDDPDDMDITEEDFRFDFERNRGITFRFEGHYGFL